MYKLESLKTSPIVKNILIKELKTLRENPTLSQYNIKYITNFLYNKDKIRLLQCIVKQINLNPISKLTTSKEYEDLLLDHYVKSELINAGPNVYILNLTDGVLLNSKGKVPYNIFRDSNSNSNINNILPLEYRPSKLLPIYSISGKKGFKDCIIPNYDDLMYIQGDAKYNINDFVTNWNSKKYNKAVFRGGSTGCGYTADTNQRIKLATMNDNENLLLDVGIVSSKKIIDTQSIKFDPVYGLGMMNTCIKSVSPLTYTQQSEYKYIIHIDGNVNAYRLLSTMATGSVIIRADSPYTSWFEDQIKPMVHYIPVKEDLSNLIKQIQWCINHDEECQKIATNALNFSREILLNPQYIKEYFVNMLLMGNKKTKTKTKTKTLKLLSNLKTNKTLKH
jgi:hypothetical protein